jgi:hypothetical protein
MLIAAAVTYYLETIRGAWQTLLMVGAGTGAVYLLRWYWWRITAWSEISAMAAAFLTTLALNYWRPFSGSEQVLFAKNMVATTAIVSTVWLAVTFATRPEPRNHLVQFYRRVRPASFGWSSIAAQTPDVKPASSPRQNLRAWGLGCALVYLSLFATGKLLLGDWAVGLVLLAGAVVSALLLYRHFMQQGWESFG